MLQKLQQKLNFFRILNLLKLMLSTKYYCLRGVGIMVSLINFDINLFKDSVF